MTHDTKTVSMVRRASRLTKPVAGLSRRAFLTRSAATVVLAGFPQILPTGVLAAVGQPGANDRIGLAGIGIGRQGSDDLRQAAKIAGIQVTAIADASLSQAQKMAQPYNAEAVQDYRRVLDRKDVDVILTATPDHWRSLVCIHSCQAGKDVYAEKPLTLTIREGRLMVEAARKYKRIVQTGSQQRSMIRNIIGCEFIRSGKLGKISRVIACNYPSPWECAFPAQPVPEGLDWNLWCGPAPFLPYHKDLCGPRAIPGPGWISFRPYSGGEMTGWGAHGLDQVQCALGMDEGGPIEVWVEGPKFDPPTYTAPETRARGEKICGQPTVFFRYPGDIIMELGKGPGGGAIFVGEKGQVTINRGVCESDPEELLVETLRNRPQGVNESHLQNWIDCVRSRKKPHADIEIGHRSTTVCHLGNIARWVGRKLRWDPVKEIFPDDPEANQYLDRERRKPWTLPTSV